MHPLAGSAPHVESLVLHASEAPRVRPSQGQAMPLTPSATLRALGKLGHPNAAFTGPGNASNVGRSPARPSKSREGSSSPPPRVQMAMQCMHA